MTPHRWFVRPAGLFAAAALLVLPGCSDTGGPPDGGMDGAPEFQYALGNPTDAVTLDEPSALAVDRNGNIYVADTDNNYYLFYDRLDFVHKLGPDGRLLARWPVPEPNAGSVADRRSRVKTRSSADFRSPAYPSLATIGDDVLLSLPSRSRVFRFDATGDVIASWGTYGSGEGQFRSIQEVAVDGDGLVYALDGGNFRVQKFSADGTFLRQWGRQGTHDGEFESTIGMAVDPRGFVYVADRDLKRIQKFDLDGAFLASWTVPTPSSSSRLSRLAIDAAGNLLLLMNEDRLLTWSPEGDLLDDWSTRVTLGAAGNSSSAAYAVAVEPAGTILTLDVGWRLLMRFSPDGDWLEALGARYGDSAGQFRNPTQLVIDGAGNVYILAGDAEIFVFSRGGEFLVNRRPELNPDSYNYDYIRDMARWSFDSIILRTGRNGYFEFDSAGNLTPLAFADADDRFPTAMASDASDGVILLRDKVVTVHGPRGELLRSFPFDQPGDEAESYTDQVLRGPGGTIWVVYRQYPSDGSYVVDDRIRSFSAAGVYRGDFALSADGPQSLFNPTIRDVAFDSDGYLHVLSGTSKAITRFSRNGDIVGEWSLDSLEDSPIPFSRLAIDGSSGFYLLDYGKDRVLKFAY